MPYTGRRVIYCDYPEITLDNIGEVLKDAIAVHEANRIEINYLYKYYRGEQPILNRTKEVRPEINNRIVENRANEIVAFKVGYLMGEPVQYVARTDNAKNIDKLNEFMFSEDKGTSDTELANWMHIAGVGYRMVLQDNSAEEDEAPFEIYTLDPRNTFVVRYVGVGNPVVMGVNYVTMRDGKKIYTCYTENEVYTITDEAVSVSPQALGIPIIEYPLNDARLGAFEIVLPLLDAINKTDSNRLDGVEQFVQALMLFHNVDITSDDFKALREQGAIKYRDADSTLKGDIQYLTAELNQTQTQTLVDHLYDTVLTICGMPNRNGGSSTSDTGSAVIMRDGWSDAEARAKDTENMFKRSEKEFLKLVLKICDWMSNLPLKMSDIDVKFTRRNYENIGTKATVLTTLLGCDKVAPELAFQHSGMFSDPTSAYLMSKEYYESNERADTDDSADTEQESYGGDTEEEDGDSNT